MGYLFHILLAIGIQAMGEANLALGPRLPFLVVALLVLPSFAASRARKSGTAGRFARQELIGRCVQNAAPVLHFLAVWAFGWVDTVRSWTGSGLDLFGWPEPAMLLSLAPFVLYELACIDAYARVHGLSKNDARHVRNFQSRLFLSGLLPLCLYILVASAVGWNDAVRVHIERVALWNAVFIVGMLFLLALFLPFLLKNTWETTPLADGPHRDLLDAVAKRADFRCNELLLWRTGNLMANAAIVGFFPSKRSVLFSDSLLSILDLRELAAVFAHEIGHAVKHHVFVFLAWAIAFFLGGDILATWTFGGLESGGEWLASGTVVGILLLWYFGFGWLSRRFELEADLYSVRLLGDHGAMIRALERVGGRLRDVAGWRHFSTADRVAFIERAAVDPGFAHRFLIGLRAWALLGVLLALLAIGFHALGLFDSYDRDRIQAELCLGNYSKAGELAATWVPEADDELGRLVAFADRYVHDRADTEPVSTEELATSLTEALAARELGWSLGLAELAALRGVEDADRIAFALDALVAEEFDEARSLLDAVEEPWRSRVGPLVPAQAP